MPQLTAGGLAVTQTLGHEPQVKPRHREGRIQINGRPIVLDRLLPLACPFGAECEQVVRSRRRLVVLDELVAHRRRTSQIATMEQEHGAEQRGIGIATRTARLVAEERERLPERSSRKSSSATERSAFLVSGRGAELSNSAGVRPVRTAMRSAARWMVSTQLTGVTGSSKGAGEGIVGRAGATIGTSGDSLVVLSFRW